jgi:hypothetical protein
MIPQDHRKAHFFLRNGDLISFSGLISTPWVRLKVTFDGIDLLCILRKCCRMPRPVGGDEYTGSKFDRQSRQGGIVLLNIFAETGKSRLSLKPRPVGG